MRNNEEYWAKAIFEQAKNITKKLGDERTIPLALKSEHYINGLSQNIGFVTNYNDLKNIADIFHIPVPFLAEAHFYKKDKDVDDNDIFKRMTQLEIITKNDQRQRFYQMYEHIISNIVALIENDQTASL
jgi:hypothetical protein